MTRAIMGYKLRTLAPKEGQIYRLEKRLYVFFAKWNVPDLKIERDLSHSTESELLRKKRKDRSVQRQSLLRQRTDLQ